MSVRLLIAALVLTFTVAVTASVFAIWPVVADAPWEDDAPAVVIDRTDTIRCEGALSFRDSTVQATIRNLGVDVYDDQLRQAEREIDLYC